MREEFVEFALPYGVDRCCAADDARFASMQRSENVYKLARMSWIKTIAYEDATGRLRHLYDRVKGPNNRIDNILLAHGLRPHTLEGHMALYKCVLHHSGNLVPKWFLETLGIWVSLLNRCGYCVEHHFAGLQRLLNDEARANAIRLTLEARRIEDGPFTEREKAALSYVEALTLTPWDVNETLIQKLRSVGYDDGQILEINQVAAYFSYANRTVLGLGCSTRGDVLGLSPSNSVDSDDWSHR